MGYYNTQIKWNKNYGVYVLINVLCTRVSSLHRYETNGASTAQVEDGVASTT